MAICSDPDWYSRSCSTKTAGTSVWSAPVSSCADTSRVSAPLWGFRNVTRTNGAGCCFCVVAVADHARILRGPGMRTIGGGGVRDQADEDVGAYSVERPANNLAAFRAAVHHLLVMYGGVLAAPCFQ